jgi:hypothetical protein
MSKLPACLAVDYGSYAVTFMVSQLPPPVSSAAGWYGCPGIRSSRHRTGTSGRKSGLVKTGAAGGKDG